MDKRSDDGVRPKAIAQQHLLYCVEQESGGGDNILFVSHLASLQQSSGCIAVEQLGIPAVNAQHFNRLVPRLVADLEQVHAALHRARYQSKPAIRPALPDGSP
jgi:hypothetical protein